jgi:hypothetical protein
MSTKLFELHDAHLGAVTFADDNITIEIPFAFTYANPEEVSAKAPSGEGAYVISLEGAEKPSEKFASPGEEYINDGTLSLPNEQFPNLIPTYLVGGPAHLVLQMGTGENYSFRCRLIRICAMSK